MAFWSIGGGLSTVSAVEKVLSRHEFTFKDVLDSEDLLMEVKAPNPKVIDYLSQPNIILELVKLVEGAPHAKPTGYTTPNSNFSKGSAAKMHPKEQGIDNHGSMLEDDDVTLSDSDEDQDNEPDYCQAAAKILSTDVWTLIDALMKNEEAMKRLWGILANEAATNIQLSCFTQIMENLLEKKTSTLVEEYVNKLPHLVDCFLLHVDHPGLIDLLLKIISTDHPSSPTDVLNTLYEQQLIPKMISRLSPEYSQNEQMAVGDFLKAFITISGGNKRDACTIGPNQLSRQLVSEACIKQLLKYMLEGGSGMCIAVGVIIEIIRKNNSDYDPIPILETTLESHPPTLRDSIYLGTLVKLFADAIPKFQEMLRKKSDDLMEMPFGTIKPLGFERFRICELYAELLHCSNMALLNDPRGEEIVNLREAERQRLYYQESMSRTLQKMDENEKMSHSFSPLPSSPSGDMHLDTSDSDEDKTPEGFNPNIDLEAEEAAIRREPVIGDQLKIVLNDSDCIGTVLDMLFEFPWNNFLHNVVFDVIQQICNGSMSQGYNKFLAIHLFTKSNITKKIVAGQAMNDKSEAEQNMRLGYVGHLTLISEEIVKFVSMFPFESVCPEIARAVQDLEWTNYVENTLLDLREQYNTILGGPKTDALDGMEDMGKHDDRSLEEAERLGNLDLDDSEDRFSRYISHQLPSTNSGFGSSDEDEEGWETIPRQIGRDDAQYNSDDDDEEEGDEEESVGLRLVQSHSYDNS